MRDLSYASAQAMLLLWILAQPLSAACPPPGYDRAALEALKAAHFELVDDAKREKLALSLLDCLADSEPLLRDDSGTSGPCFGSS